MKWFAILILMMLTAVAFGQQSETTKIELRATNAVIIGNQKLSNNKIGSWDSISNRVIWTASVARAGSYRVIFEYACPADYAGTEFDVWVGSQKANGIIAPTASWTSFVKMDLGPVLIRKPGDYKVEIAPTRSLRTRSMMDVRSVTLQREE